MDENRNRRLFTGRVSSSNTPGNKKQIPCRFFAEGHCRKGDSCEHAHGVMEHSRQPQFLLVSVIGPQLLKHDNQWIIWYPCISQSYTSCALSESCLTVLLGICFLLGFPSLRMWMLLDMQQHQMQWGQQVCFGFKCSPNSDLQKHIGRMGGIGGQQLQWPVAEHLSHGVWPSSAHSHKRALT